MFIQSGPHSLAVQRTPPAGVSGPPVIIVPGYGMNSFIFGFHPGDRGLLAPSSLRSSPPGERSLVDALAHAGLVVYRFDMRGTGKSQSDVLRDHGFAELALEDLAAVVRAVREREHAGKVHLIGCSLGAAIALTYIAHRGQDEIASFVSLGGLVRWVEVHPLLRLAFRSPAFARALRIKGSRRAARFLLPIITRVYPRLLSIYVNTASSDMSRAAEITQTVEDPHAPLNEEIAWWIARQDLIVRGVNVSRAIEDMTLPAMSVVAKDDGIVPEACGVDIHARWGTRDKQLLIVGGDPALPIAHADLFLARGAEKRVFEPVARFLLAHSAG